jgi:Ser/Thr protein kinase RdoA (MazF antagonist)
MAPPGFRSNSHLHPDRYFDSYGGEHGDQFADFDAAGSGWFVAECAASEDLRECVGA